MIYEPQNGTEELLMLVGRVEALKEVLDYFNYYGLSPSLTLFGKILGFDSLEPMNTSLNESKEILRKISSEGIQNAKDNSAVSNNEVD